MSYAEGTTVPVAKTRGEIEALVQRYGASQFSSGWIGTQAAISFAAHGRLVRFVLDLPDLAWAKAELKKRPRWRWHTVPDDAAKNAQEAEARRRWRCLLLAIKAKLEVVDSKIATFDEEFLAHIVGPNNLTVYEAVKMAESKGHLMLTAADPAPSPKREQTP